MRSSDWQPLLASLSEGWAVELEHTADRSGPPSSWEHDPPVFVVYMRRGVHVAVGRNGKLADAIAMARSKARQFNRESRS